MAFEKFRILSDGQEIIAAVRRKYMNKLDHVVPEEILVINAYGKGGNFLARIGNVVGQFKLLFDEKYKDILYVIIMNKDKLRDLCGNSKNKALYRKLQVALIFHELFHIHPKRPGTLRGHTVHDFTEVLKILGISIWSWKGDVPDILASKKKKKKKGRK